MNNIEILEMQLKKIKDFCKDNKHYYPEELPYYMFWDGKQAEIVENLIQENKELKEKTNKAINMLEKHIQYCEQEAKGSLNNEVCNIALRFDKHLLQVLKGE